MEGGYTLEGAQTVQLTGTDIISHVNLTYDVTMELFTCETDELNVIKEGVRSLRKGTKKTNKSTQQMSRPSEGSATDDGTIRTLVLPSESRDDDNRRKSKRARYHFEIMTLKITLKMLFSH